MLQEHARQEFHDLYREQQHHFQQPEEYDRKLRHTHQANWPNSLNFNASLASGNEIIQCTRFEERMQQGFKKASSRLKPKKAKGEVIEVHGGRIVRSSGRKDRHSKVCTARGPKDRRVRLSPNTAIQFYDVQDRLGYDRPSKAIDWLLKEAKAAIDALDDSSHATYLNDAVVMTSNGHHSPQGFQDPSPSHLNHHHARQLNNFSNSKCAIQNHDQLNDNPTSHISFFSMVNGATLSSSSEIHTYPQDGLSSRNKGEAQGFSASFQNYQNGSVLFPGDQRGPFATSTPSHSQVNSGMATFRKFFSWDANSDLANEKANELLLINSLPLQFPPALSQNHIFLQREPLQSTLFPIHASSNMQFSNVNASYSSIGFSNEGLSGFEEQNPISSKPSSATSFLQD